MRSLWMIGSFGLALGLGACGRLDNSQVRGLLSDAGAPQPRCDELTTVSVQAPALAPLVAGRPWTAWLHTADDAPVTWSADGLPDGLTLDARTGLIAGLPSESGTAHVTAHASLDTCPDARGSVAFPLTVLAGCDGDCGPPVACEDALSEALFAFVREPVVAPGETLSRDGLFVGTADWRLPLGSGATHEMTLWNGKSRTEKKVTIDYALPGALTLAPAEGLTVDLRYVRGHHGDDYLFLTNQADGSLVFVSYRGYLSRDEISARCPDNADGKRCRLPSFVAVPTACSRGEPDACGERRVTALEVSTTEGKRQLMPGQAAELKDGDEALIRVADAWERDTWCATPNEPIPFFQAFYELPIPGGCAYFEIRHTNPPAVTTEPASFVMRVLHPFEAGPTRFTWAAAMEDDGASEVIMPGPRDLAQFDPLLPLVGDYRISLLNPSMTWGGKGKLYPCGFQVTPQLDLRLAPPRKYRVELWWEAGAPALPEMWANGAPAIAQSDRVLAADFDGVFSSKPITVTATGEGSVKANVRITAPYGRFAFTDTVEAGGEAWIVGFLGQNGFTPAQ